MNVKLYHLTGTGHFVNDNGDQVNYPIRKLRIVSDNGDSYEAKLDKANSMAINLMSEKIGSPEETQDSNGVACTAQEFEL